MVSARRRRSSDGATPRPQCAATPFVRFGSKAAGSPRKTSARPRMSSPRATLAKALRGCSSGNSRARALRATTAAAALSAALLGPA